MTKDGALPAPSPDLKVLLVEDSSSDARLIKAALDRMKNPSFILEHRDRVDGALDRIKEGGLDVVLSDLSLPDSPRGQRLAELVAAAGRVPVVVLTGSGESESGLDVLQKGAQDYLCKDEMDSRNLARTLRFAVERRRTGEALELVAKLKELDQTRSDFISAVTHELRTPLVSLKGYTAMLQKTLSQVPEAEAQRMLAVIAANSARLERLVNQVLTVAKIDRGRLSLLREGVDLVYLAQACARVMEGQSRKHRVKVERKGRGHEVICDPFQVEQVVLNLLSNAIKYWPEGGDILLRVEGEDRDVRISVQDQGLGIPEGERERIFSKFERIEDESRRGIEGAGLGLYLVRQIVELHGGRVELQSKLGQGSTFSFTLPRVGKEAA